MEAADDLDVVRVRKLIDRLHRRQAVAAVEKGTRIARAGSSIATDQHNALRISIQDRREALFGEPVARWVGDRYVAIAEISSIDIGAYHDRVALLEIMFCITRRDATRFDRQNFFGVDKRGEEPDTTVKIDEASDWR